MSPRLAINDKFSSVCYHWVMDEKKKQVSWGMRYLILLWYPLPCPTTAKVYPQSNEHQQGSEETGHQT